MQRRIPFSFLALQTVRSRLRLGSATACQPYHAIEWFRCNHGRDDHAPFFLYATAALREVWVHGSFLICSSFLAGVVQISR